MVGNTVIPGSASSVQTVFPQGVPTSGGQTPQSLVPAINSDLLHPSYLTRYPQWVKVRDCLEGEDRIKARGQTYLPKREKQTDEDYKSYLARAVFVNFIGRTIESLTASIFRRKEKLDLPPRMEYLRNSATPDGLTFRQLTRWLTQEVILVSRAGLLLDLQNSTGDGEGLPMPKIVRFPAESILSWDDENRQPQWILLMESLGPYESTVFARKRKISYLLLALDRNGLYCVARPTDQQLAAADNIQDLIDTLEADDPDKVVRPTSYGNFLREIPFEFCGALENTPSAQKPTMLDIANINIAHYRGSGNLETARYYVGSPVYVLMTETDAEEDEDLLAAPNQVWTLGKDDSAEILEFQGQGLSSLENGQEEKEEYLRSLGAVLLSQRKNAAARSESSDQDTQTSREATLTDIVESVNAALMKMLQRASTWMGIPESERSSILFYLNRHFFAPNIDARVLRAIDMMVGRTMSIETAYDMLSDGGWLSTSTSLEEFRKMVETYVLEPQQAEQAATTAPPPSPIAPPPSPTGPSGST